MVKYSFIRVSFGILCIDFKVFSASICYLSLLKYIVEYMACTYTTPYTITVVTLIIIVIVGFTMFWYYYADDNGM